MAIWEEAQVITRLTITPSSGTPMSPTRRPISKPICVPFTQLGVDLSAPNTIPKLGYIIPSEADGSALAGASSLRHHPASLERIARRKNLVAGAVYLRALQALPRFCSPLSLQSQEHNLRYLRFIRRVLTGGAGWRDPQGGGPWEHTPSASSTWPSSPIGCRTIRRGKRRRWPCWTDA